MDWSQFQEKAKKHRYEPRCIHHWIELVKIDFEDAVCKHWYSFQSDGSVISHLLNKKENTTNCNIIGFERTPIQMWHLMLGLENKNVKID